MRSIQEGLTTLPDETVVYCGHGPGTSIGRKRVMTPWL
jgi:glyoxylase-like metal-dependent hydrolase (beta-lactamase superfamily II)